MLSTGEGHGKPLQYSCVENPMNSMKRQKGMTLKMSPLGSKVVQYVTGEEWRAITDSSKKNEAAWPKWKQRPVVDVSGGESKVWCCKEQYCTGTWNVRSMQVKLVMVEQDRGRINIMLGISEVKWTGMGEFNSGDHNIYYCGQKSHRRNGVALIINKSPKCNTWVQSQKQ